MQSVIPARWEAETGEPLKAHGQAGLVHTVMNNRDPVANKMEGKNRYDTSVSPLSSIHTSWCMLLYSHIYTHMYIIHGQTHAQRFKIENIRKTFLIGNQLCPSLTYSLHCKSHWKSTLLWNDFAINIHRVA